ncbi:hypothetical protein BpV2_137c [Bathycoccus sp. RCC1105 virus BpV2]|nr:hypothetical protein BpV2_137c [Bathycoccus sp. RCC1105 virus BpV2]
MSNKNQQMKIAVVAVIIILLISSIIAAVRSSTSSEPTIKTDDTPTASQDMAAKKELVKAVEDLETIKDRIKNVEEGYRENYRSETNNGLTVVGTLMEQMIDVMVAVLKQPLVAEAVSKRIVNKQDADEIAEYIEMLGQEVVKEVEQTPLLKCRKARTWECTEGEGMERLCTWKEAEGDVPDWNCDAYEVNHMKIREGQRRAVANLYNKVLSVVEKAEERDKMYRILKNVSIDNMTQYGISTGMSDEDIKSRADNFQKQDELETIALAHYKYLGYDLKRELGDSINISELTGEEEGKVKYLIDRNKGRKSKNIVKVTFAIYEEPDYKGNNQQFNAELPEGEIIKIGNSKNNPVKSLRLGENVILEARRVDNNDKIELRGKTENNNTGSGYYNIVIMVATNPSQQVSEGIQSVEGYRI